MNEKRISIDYSYLFPFIKDQDITDKLQTGLEALKTLKSKQGKGNDFLGWIDLPENIINSSEFEEITAVSNEINKTGDLLVCIGIGGSYLGARAVIEALLPPFHNLQDKERRSGPKIIYAGHNISGKYTESVLEEIKRHNSVYTIVISKSGTTTEPGISFRLIKELMEKKYGKIEHSKRIIAITDKNKGALKKLADANGYRSFVIADDVGGRYSVFSPVGLLPIASSGIDIKRFLKGAIDQKKSAFSDNFSENPSLCYAVLRNILLEKGFHTEILASYEPSIHYISEWWKQLFGESEGKDKKGIFTASVDFTTDLHSLGQMIQDGQRFMFETVINIENNLSDIKVNSTGNDDDQLEYLSGKNFDDINRTAMKGTLLAHYDGGVPNIIFNLPELNSYYIGRLLYLFECACGISGYILGVNPFDQPGVEQYKNNMFALLNKPDPKYQKARDQINNKIKSLPSGKICS